MVLIKDSMNSDKKDKEWVVIQYFREKYADFPKGKLVKSESPDFILKQGRKKSIGIELTQLDIGQSHTEESWSEHLNDLLSKKEDKLRIYKKKWLNEYWLLIAIENIDPIETGLYTIHLDSKFDKVFLFDVFTGLVYSLL
jgi:hypothetical protein